ncbi:MAG: TolC family protein [Opitutaceae bacterium]
MRFLLLCVLLGFSLATFASAAPTTVIAVGDSRSVEPELLTLETAIASALAHNFTIASARFEPQIARGDQLVAAGAFDPTLNASAKRSDYRSDPYNPLTGLYTPLYIEKTDTLSVSLDGKLPFGLRYSFVSETQNYRDTDATSRLLDSYSTFNGIRLTQPLLRGFGFGANLAGVRLARARRGIARAQYHQAVTDTITSTISAYNNLYYAQQAYQNTLRSRKLANDLLTENRRRAEVGSISPADVTIAAARVARIENGVIQTERNLLDTANYFRTLLTSDRRPPADQLPRIAPPLVAPTPEIDRAAALQRAYELRPDYRQMLETVRRAQAGLSDARSAALPQIDLVGSYGYTGTGGTFDDAYRSSRRRDTASWSAGAVVSLPLPLRDGRGRVLSSRLTLEQARTDLARLEQQIAVDIANASGQIEATARRVEATRRARQLADDSLVAEQKRLQVGQSDTFTVLQFQELLSAAEQSEYRAVADYNIALADYDRAIGITLQRHAVTLEE